MNVSVCTVDQIVERTGMSRRTVQRALRDLEATGHIIKHGDLVYEVVANPPASTILALPNAGDDAE